MPEKRRRRPSITLDPTRGSIRAGTDPIVAREVQRTLPDLELHLTKKVAELMDQGRVEEAKAVHNATVEERLQAAQRGEIINLTDLMASREELELRRRRKS